MNDKLRTCLDTAYRRTCFTKEGQEAGAELMRFGEEGYDAFLELLADPPETDSHPRDLSETESYLFTYFAEVVPERLIKSLEDGTVEPSTVFHALGFARGKASIDTLIAGLQFPDAFERSAAVRSLILRRGKRAAGALIDRLRDRSSNVKFTVVWGMQRSMWLRRPEAIPALEKIVASKSVEKNCIGMHRAAQEVIERIRRENP